MSLTSLVVAVVYFAGVVGPKSARLEQQLGELLAREASAETIVLGESVRRAIALRQRPARRAVRDLGGDALVIGRLLTGSTFVLKIAIYGPRGEVRGRFDIPLGQDALDTDAEERLRRVVLPRLREIAPSAVARPAPAPPPLASPRRPEALPPAPPPLVEAAEPAAAPAPPPEPGALPGLTTEATLGLGVLSRSFAPEPRAIPAYQASSVPAVRLAGAVHPLPALGLAFSLERALGMTSELAGESLPTTLGAWHASVHALLRRDLLSAGALVGVGQRSFAIESKSPARSPDGDYTHLVLGGRGELAIGRFVSVGAEVAYEPVVSGAEPTLGAFGPAERWGFEASAEVEIHPWSFLVLGAHAGYQRFAWDWPSRGLGGATDEYFSAGVSAGVRLVPVQ